MKTYEDYAREADEQERKHRELMATLEVPTYEGRSLQAQWVKSKEPGAITGTTGWTAGCPSEVFDLLEVGSPYILETRNFGLITGWLIDGKWYGRKSDQDLERERLAYIAASDRKAKEYADEHRAEWAAREDALPEWVGKRIRALHDDPEFESQPMGWGYELMVCELAVLYAEMGEEILDKDQFTVPDSPEITEFAATNGTSGAQHGFALSLAKHHLRAIRKPA